MAVALRLLPSPQRCGSVPLLGIGLVEAAEQTVARFWRPSVWSILRQFNNHRKNTHRRDLRSGWRDDTRRERLFAHNVRRMPHNVRALAGHECDTLAL